MQFNDLFTKVENKYGLLDSEEGKGQAAVQHRQTNPEVAGKNPKANNHTKCQNRQVETGFREQVSRYTEARELEYEAHVNNLAGNIGN